MTRILSLAIAAMTGAYLGHRYATSHPRDSEQINFAWDVLDLCYDLSEGDYTGQRVPDQWAVMNFSVAGVGHYIMEIREQPVTMEIV